MVGSIEIPALRPIFIEDRPMCKYCLSLFGRDNPVFGLSIENDFGIIQRMASPVAQLVTCDWKAAALLRNRY